MASKLGAIAVAIAICSATLSPTGVRAENGQIAAGVVGGLIGGALLGGALASRPPAPPVYYEAAPVYVDAPVMSGGSATLLGWVCLAVSLGRSL